MQFLKKISLNLLRIFILPFIFVFSVPDLKKLANDFEPTIAEVFKKYNVPGAAIAIVSSTGIILIKTYGVKNTKNIHEKVNEDTIFRIASLSKTITAALVVKLASKNILSIDDSITKYIYGIKFGGISNKYSIKLKDIISHTCGLPEYALEEFIYDSKYNFTSLNKKLRTIKVKYKPGERFQYQNYVYGLLFYVVKNAYKSSFSNAMCNELLHPLGIKLFISSQKDFNKLNNIALPHLQHQKDKTQYSPATIASNYYNVFASAGMGFNINQMAAILQVLMGGRSDVINDETINQMLQPRAYICNGNRFCTSDNCLCKKYVKEFYGYGCIIKQYKNINIYYHTGRLDGYTAWMGFSKKYDIGIVILTNCSCSVPMIISQAFFEKIISVHSASPEDESPKNIALNCYETR